MQVQVGGGPGALQTRLKHLQDKVAGGKRVLLMVGLLFPVPPEA